VDAAVGYYGGQIAGFKDEAPKCPVMLHFGETDKSIPMTDVEAVRAAHPEVTVHVYAAGHGFNCDQRADFSPENAKVARERTLAFFRNHVG
jgi:carboxymethylenebutenolidase